MNLATDHLELGERLEHTRFAQLRDAGHRPEYTDVRVIASTSSDTAYLVARVKALPEPFNPDTTDLAEDRRQFAMCSCPQFHFRCSANFEDGENPPDEWSNCKHIRESFRTEKAKNDDSQETL